MDTDLTDVSLSPSVSPAQLAAHLGHAGLALFVHLRAMLSCRDGSRRSRQYPRVSPQVNIAGWQAGVRHAIST